MDAAELLEKFKGSASVGTVFAEPYEKDGVTVIPAAIVVGGGGGGGDEAGGSGGGFGLRAKPVGAYVIRDGNVAWHPALDLNRVILGGQVVALVIALVVRGVLRKRAVSAGH